MKSVNWFYIACAIIAALFIGLVMGAAIERKAPPGNGPTFRGKVLYDNNGCAYDFHFTRDTNNKPKENK